MVFFRDSITRSLFKESKKLTKMTEYGELLNNTNDNMDEMREAFVAYFGDPIMTKTKNVNGCNIYMAKNYCLLSRLCRYLVAVVVDNGKNNEIKKPLSSLEWMSFQTRTLSENYDLPSHSYVARRGGPLDVKISRVDVTNRGSMYNCEKFDITVTLLHENNKGPTDYQPYGSLIAALETFNTIISIGKTD